MRRAVAGSHWVITTIAPVTPGSVSICILFRPRLRKCSPDELAINCFFSEVPIDDYRQSPSAGQ
jgi:hypothetical protein